MKSAKLSLMFLACAATIPAFAQNTTDSRCGITNYDSSRQTFTIINPTRGTVNQQCFITVVPKQSWAGGNPDLSTSQLVEGNYEISLSGGGGGGGGGSGSETEHGRTEGGNGGDGGFNAVPSTMVRYLDPGVYRLTIGSGGRGGAAGPNGEHVSRSGMRGEDGAPTSLTNTSTGQTVAGFSGAETWNGSYPLVAVAYSGTPTTSGGHAANGGRNGRDNDAEPGAYGNNGFITIALKDAPPQAEPAAAYVAPAEKPVAVRPARKDRN
jgi:hypothetical protein